MAEAGEDGFRQYLVGLRVTVLEADIDPRFDTAVREWAATPCPNPARHGRPRDLRRQAGGGG